MPFLPFNFIYVDAADISRRLLYRVVVNEIDVFFYFLSGCGVVFWQDVAGAQKSGGSGWIIGGLLAAAAAAVVFSRKV